MSVSMLPVHPSACDTQRDQLHHVNAGMWNRVCQWLWHWQCCTARQHAGITAPVSYRCTGLALQQLHTSRLDRAQFFVLSLQVILMAQPSNACSSNLVCQLGALKRMQTEQTTARHEQCVCVKATLVSFTSARPWCPSSQHPPSWRHCRRQRRKQSRQSAPSQVCHLATPALRPAAHR